MAILAGKNPLQKTLEFALNNPFTGVYQLNAFDLALLIPYFAVLGILSVYGLHRYEIINSVIAGLLEGCQALGCQSRPVDLLKALKDFCQHERPAERWLKGEKIFSPLSP